MRSVWSASLVIGVTLAATVAAQGGRSATSGPACDRACLDGFVNQYLEALVARDPFGLPLAAKIRL